MGCCEEVPVLYNEPNDDSAMIDEEDKSSSMVIITYDINDELTKANNNKRNKQKGLDDSDDILNDDEDDDEDKDIVEYFIDKNGNRVKVTKKGRGERKEDDLSNVSASEKAKMTPNELMNLQKRLKHRLELKERIKEEAKKEYMKNKDILDPVEKACTIKVDYFKPKELVPEFSIKIHRDIINCLIAINYISEIHYATSSEDMRIKFWNEDFNFIDEIETNIASSTILQYDSTHLLSAELDIIVAYELTSFDKAYTFKGHMNKISSIALMSDKRFASGGLDHIIRLWEMTQLTDCNGYFDGHSASITKIIEVEPDAMASGSEDKSVIIWDSKTLMTIVKLNNYFTTIELVQDENGFLLGSFDNKLRFYSKDIQMKAAFKGKFYNAKHILLLANDYVLFSNSTKKIYLLDKEYKSIECIYKGQKSLVTSIASHQLSKRFVTSGDDGKVYLWPKPIKQEDSIH